MNYTANLIHGEYASALLALFALVITAAGVAMDVVSLRLRSSAPQTPGHTVGLPLVPWMIYFLASFFWFLRGNLILSLAGLAALTVWHVLVHTRRGKTARDRT